MESIFFSDDLAMACACRRRPAAFQDPFSEQRVVIPENNRFDNLERRREQMTAKLIKGTEIREQILEEITADVANKSRKNTGSFPDWSPSWWVKIPASISYVTLKIKTAHRVGFTEVQDTQPETHH
jgi:hypothetical protein